MSVSQQLDSVGIIAFKLSNIIKSQFSTLGFLYNMPGLSPHLNIPYRNGRAAVVNVTYSLSHSKGRNNNKMFTDVPIINGFIPHSTEFSKTNLKVHVHVEQFDVRQADSYFFNAAIFLDDICLEIFSHFFSKQEVQNACLALLKMNCVDKEKQKKAVDMLANYCNDMLNQNNLKEVVALYDSCLCKDNGIDLLNIIHKSLNRMNGSNQEKLKQVLASLNMDSINQIQREIQHNLKTKKIISNLKHSNLKYIDLLIQSPKFLHWALDQIVELASLHLEKKEFHHVINLTNKYLLKHSKTSFNATKVICRVIHYLFTENNPPKNILSKIQEHMTTVASQPDLTVTDKNVLRTFVEELSIPFTSDTVLLLLVNANKNSNNKAFVKELAQIFYNHLLYLQPNMAKLAKELFLS